MSKAYDYLSMSDLSYDTRKAIVALYRKNNWNDIETDSLVAPEWAALMVFRLRATPDDAETFPKGKWATIQRIEELVTELAKAERSALPVPSV